MVVRVSFSLLPLGELKRSLFGSVFDGDSDTVAFTALATTSFLTGVQEAIGIERPTIPEAEAPARAETGLLEANVQMLEALAAWEGPWPAEFRDRLIGVFKDLADRIQEE